MNLPTRRKPIALLLLCGFAGALAGTYAGQVCAQAPAPLRVDPVLLGLPPLKPEAAPLPAEPASVEIKPVEGAAVEERPVERGRRADKLAAAAPPVAPAPTPIPAPAPAPAPQTRAPVGAASVPPVSAAAGPATTGMCTLRDDPALLGSSPAGASPTVPAKPWYRSVWEPLANAYDNGDLKLYLPVHTHHLRSKYTPEQIASYQENPLGFGVGRGLYNEKGNWEGVYAMAFQDSHFKPMYIAGYGWKSIWHPSEDKRLGLGYTAGLMARSDIFGYVPFPVALPMASLAYKNLSLEGTFVPGGKGNGNIFFIWAEWELGKNGEAIGTPARPAPEPATEIASQVFGAAVPLAQQKVPYGPTLAIASGERAAAAPASASPSSSGAATGAGTGTPAAGTQPPQVAATGARDEEEVPDVSPALALRPARRIDPLVKDSKEQRPVFLSAQRMAGETDHEYVAEGDAELRKIGTVVNSDQMTYWPIDDEIEAVGNVRLQQEGSLVSVPKMRLKLEDQVGYFEQPEYVFKRKPAAGSQGALADEQAARYAEQQQGGSSWLNSGLAMPKVIDIAKYNSTAMPRSSTEGRGEADRIDFEGENHVRMSNATFTTCSPGNDDWYAKTEELKLDYDREVGEGKNGTVYFKGTPILYSPWLSFPLNNARKSGFLAPTFGSNSTSGIYLSVPYYWNIAPNRDLTITPRLLTKNGLQLNNEYRYLERGLGGVYTGVARVEYLPDDKLRNGDNRYGISLMHQQTTSFGLAAMVNYNKVSDSNYFTDLSSHITNTANTQLLQQAVFSYGGGGWWSATANFQQYQTLQPDPKNPVLEQYRMLPQLTFNMRKPDLYTTDASFMGQYTAFSKPQQIINGVATTNPNGQRTVLYPQLALPFVTPGWYVTPKIGLNVHHYSLTGQAAGIPDTINTTLPIASVDSGMTFERSSKWFGRDYTQTLEPRLYYLNVPYRDQSKIPIFDTGLADFNFAQIFSENQFSGWDRVSNANQLTAAVATRLLEPNSGTELVRAMVGQRFYFSKNQVALPSVPGTITVIPQDQQQHRSDFLAAFSGQILPKVFTDVTVQYNPADRQLQRYSFGTRYQPAPGKVLNAAYRYNRDLTAPVDQVDFSGQWPVSGRWYVVGRLNYSFKDDGTNLSTTSQSGRMIESLAGLEYNGGCWVVRGVVRRLALTQDTASSAFFVQLELNDFSRIGSNPLDLLKRSIQGYGLVNQPVADPVFGD